MTALHDAVVVVAYGSLAYFAALNLAYAAFTVAAATGVAGLARRRPFGGLDVAFASPLTPGVSILLPAYNEEAGIVESVRSLLALRYPQHEIVIVNDGSTDATLERLRDAFDLVEVRRPLRSALPTAPVQRVFLSRTHRRLVVADKANGGKADALNAATNLASFPYLCAVDADAVLEEHALLQLMRPVLEAPDRVVAVGGIVRVANGCRIDHGRVLDVRLPPSRVAALQAVEYLRAFLVGRIVWSRLRALLIVSGAFGLFRRDVVAAVGGWRRDTVGEDIELVVRIHRYMRDRDEPYEIAFVPDPVCWTEAPESLRTLARQRRRWQRGLLETLWLHRSVLLNARYGVLGLVAFPFFVVFEVVGPLVQIAAAPVAVVGCVAGVLSTSFLLAFMLVAGGVSVVLSLAALSLEELGFRRYLRRRDGIRMVVLAVVENVGYRQLVDLWRVGAVVDLVRGRREWGEMPRVGLSRGESF